MSAKLVYKLQVTRVNFLRS